MGEMLIDKDTIGQYTGLKDINGTKIFEGDIVELTQEGRELFGTKDHLTRKYQLVGYKDGTFMTGRSNYNPQMLDTYLWLIRGYITVAGNKWDNPELLEKE